MKKKSLLASLLSAGLLVASVSGIASAEEVKKEPPKQGMEKGSHQGMEKKVEMKKDHNQKIQKKDGMKKKEKHTKIKKKATKKTQ